MITKLTKKGITIKIVSGNYHREVGLCEQAVYNVKQLIINTFCNKVITSILDFQHMCGLIEFFINRHPTLNLNDRLVTPFIYDNSLKKITDTCRRNILRSDKFSLM